MQDVQHVQEVNSVNPTEATEGANDSNVVEPIEPIEPQTGDQDEAGPSAWVPGPFSFIDPFRRTSGGFQIYGRRRSVCVMTFIPESPETPEIQPSS